MSFISFRTFINDVVSCPSIGPKYLIFMPSKMFCCCMSNDFRLLLKRIIAFFLSSVSSPHFAICLDMALRKRLYPSDVCKFSRYCFIPPTLRSMAILLSFSIMSRLLGVAEALLRPSNAKPPLIEPSPITATMCLFVSFFRLALTAIPSAAEMEFDACPHVNVSYWLSDGVGNGASPFNFLFVQNLSRLPVKIL